MWKMFVFLGLLALTLSAHAAIPKHIYLIWEWPVDAPAVEGFALTTVTAGHDPTETMIPFATARACPQLPDATPAMACADVTCPAEGVLSFWLTAKQGSRTSPESDILTAQVTPDCSVTTLSLVPSDGTVPKPAPAPPSDPAPSTDPPPETPPSPDPPPAPQPAVPVLKTVTAVDTNLVLGWTYPRDQAPPKRFILTYTSAAFSDPALFAVPLHEVTACRTVPGVEANTWCARLACPGTGTWTFWVQPDFGTATAPRSTTQTCTIATSGIPCTCNGGQDAPADPPVAVPMPDPAPPSPEDKPPHQRPAHHRHARHHRHR